MGACNLSKEQVMTNVDHNQLLIDNGENFHRDEKGLHKTAHPGGKLILRNKNNKENK